MGALIYAPSQDGERKPSSGEHQGIARTDERKIVSPKLLDYTRAASFR